MQAPPGPSAAPLARAEVAVHPLAAAEIDELESLLAAVPAPLEPLDVGVLDGFLCGVLVQPKTIEPARWLRHVTDVDGRSLPAHFDTARLHALVRRRHAELAQAIAARRWFDPWVFELGPEGEPTTPPASSAALATSAAAASPGPDAGAAPPPIESVYPWVAGFATALELFPALMERPAEDLVEPLALLYRHLDPEDLEDADALLEEIELLEPVADLEPRRSRGWCGRRCCWPTRRSRRPLALAAPAAPDRPEPTRRARASPGSDRQRVDVDRAAQDARPGGVALVAQRVQRRQPAREQAPAAPAREVDSSSICMRSTFGHARDRQRHGRVDASPRPAPGSAAAHAAAACRKARAASALRASARSIARCDNGGRPGALALAQLRSRRRRRSRAARSAW